MRSLLILVFFLTTFSLQAETVFLTISDIHYESGGKSGDGQDTNDELLQLAFKKLTELSKQVDFIITLGDFPGHSWNQIQREKNEQTVFLELYHANVSKKPFFYVTGNNDSIQGDYLSFQWEGKSPLTLTTLWQHACIYCDGLMIDESNLQKGGYYSTYVIPKNNEIMLIALNSTQFANRPWYLPQYPHQDDAAYEQLNWLESQLRTHSAKQLIIAMHIPPGLNYKNKLFWKEEYLQRFIAILKQYHHQFSEINFLTAHNHRDELRKISLEGKNIYGYSTPSISRIFHNYSGIKIFTLDAALKLHNFTTFFTSADNEWGNDMYQARGDEKSILAACGDESLAQCLDRLQVNAICNAWEDGLFYSVRSPAVTDKVCRSNFVVN